MVCDKGKGIILESALKGYSARPLEIRDGCSPIIQYCELHDGKHRHVLEWLQQIPKVIKPVDIEALGWSEDQLAAEDEEVMRSSPLARELGDSSGPIVIIGEDGSGQQPSATPGTTTTTTAAAAGERVNQEGVDKTAVPAAVNENVNVRYDNDSKPKDVGGKAVAEEPKKVEQTEQPLKRSKSHEKSASGKKKEAKKKPRKGKTGQKVQEEKKSDSGSSEEQTSSITLSTADKSVGDDKNNSDDETSESTSESSSMSKSNDDVLTSSESSSVVSATKMDLSHQKTHSHKRSTEKEKKPKSKKT